MATITTRAGKGSELSHAELDLNFTSLAADVAQVLPVVAPYTAAIPFTGQVAMAQTTVAGAIAFTVDTAGSVEGAVTSLDLIANGTNAPTFSGDFREWGGSMGYDNRAGIRNCLTFFKRSGVYWYCITQAVGAVAESTPVAPSFSIAPSLSAAAVGTAASYSSGTFAGVPTPSSTQQWTIDGVDISGATASTYTPVSGDSGKLLRVRQTATNASGAASSTSNSVTVGAAATVPGAPTIGTATAGNASASVTFTAPGSNGGSAITGYTVTSSPGGFTGTGSASPITVSGLTNGTAYTFTVTATNAIGTGAASAASNSVTPAAPLPYLRYSTTGAVSIVEAGDAAVGYTYTGTTGDFSSFAVFVDTPVCPDLASWSAEVSGAGGLGMMALSTSATAHKYTTAPKYKVGLWAGAGTFQRMTDGIAITDTGVAVVAGSRVRLRRSGTSIVAEYSTDGGATYPNTIYTWTSVTTSGTVLYGHFSCAATPASPITKPMHSGMTA